MYALWNSFSFFSAHSCHHMSKWNFTWFKMVILIFLFICMLAICNTLGTIIHTFPKACLHVASLSLSRSVSEALNGEQFFQRLIYQSSSKLWGVWIQRGMLNIGNKNDIQNGTTINASKRTATATVATTASTTIIAALLNGKWNEMRWRIGRAQEIALLYYFINMLLMLLLPFGNEAMLSGTWRRTRGGCGCYCCSYWNGCLWLRAKIYNVILSLR